MPYANPERKRAYDRAYRSANRDKHLVQARSRQRAYHATHRDERNAYHRALEATHPERNMLRSARFRAKRASVPCALTIADVRELLRPMRCSATGLPLAHNKGEPSALSPSLDRIVPALGYVPGNVRLVCHRFNALRGTDPVSHDFRHALRVLAETSHTSDQK